MEFLSSTKSEYVISVKNTELSLNLSSTETFTGVYDIVSSFSEITILVILGTGESATLNLESSTDKIHSKKRSILITNSVSHVKIPVSQWFRVTLNADQGTTAIGSLQTIYHKYKSKALTVNVNDVIDDNTDAEVVKAVIVGQTSNGNYGNISTTSGGLDMALSKPLDAFGRLQVSNPISLLSSKQQTLDDPYQMVILTSGTGDINYTPPYPQSNMTISSNGDRAIRQSKLYSSYQPGKSLTFFITGTLLDDSLNDNIRARIGCFDDLNDKTVDSIPTGDGFCFQLVGSTITPILSLIHRTSNTDSLSPGSPIQTDTEVLQDGWNIDKLDGTGVSGYTIDPTKRQIFTISLAWLGVGDVLCGILNNNTFIPCHRFEFINGEGGINEKVAFTTRGSLPVRYELEATGVPTSTAVMRSICSSVSSEGGFTPEGIIYSIGRGATTKTTSITESPVLALRLNQTGTALKRVRVTLNILKTNFIVTGSGDSIFNVYLFRTSTQFGVGPLTSSSFVNQSTDPSLLNSAAEYDISATAVDLTGTTYPFHRLEQGFFSKEASTIEANLKERLITLNSDIEGNSDMIVITMQTFSGNQTISSSIQWQEYE